jgi:hypothetical protein
MPMPWPKPEPLPKPGEESLYDSVDWMTFTHEQLYDMVHQGVDVGGATALAAKWAKLGDTLHEIADSLAQALAASEEAWQGEAAEQARGSFSALSTWSHDAAATATDVSGCISIEANNADNARRSMPEPVAGIRVPTPVPAHQTSPMAAAFGSARDLVKDPHGPTARQQAAHQEAARVMDQFQHASREVYGTVPAFAPPSLRQPLAKISERPPVPPPQPVVEPVQELAGPPPAPVGGPPPPRPVHGPGPAPGSGSGPGPSPAPTPEPAEPKPAAPSEARPAARGVAAPAAAASGASGGMPPAMGAAGAGHKEEEMERKAPRYLEGDPDLWGIADRMAPPVIGDEHGA